MLLYVSWAHKIDIEGGDGCVRWLVKKNNIYIKKNEKKKTYLGPKQHVLMCCLGPQNAGGGVGEVWEVR